MPDPAMKFRQHTFLTASQAISGLNRVARVEPKLGTLIKHAGVEGLVRLTGARNAYGVSTVIKAAAPVRDPRTGRSVTEITYETYIQDLRKPGSKDAWAVGTTVVTAGREREVYTFMLQAPGGNFARAKELTVSPAGRVIAAASWWSRMKACLKRKCIATCVASLATCVGTWSAYLACVAAKCGGCWVTCAACAACRCRWYCKWAVGCCRD